MHPTPQSYSWFLSSKFPIRTVILSGALMVGVSPECAFSLVLGLLKSHVLTKLQIVLLVIFCVYQTDSMRCFCLVSQKRYGFSYPRGPYEIRRPLRCRRRHWNSFLLYMNFIAAIVWHTFTRRQFCLEILWSMWSYPEVDVLSECRTKFV